MASRSSSLQAFWDKPVPRPETAPSEWMVRPTPGAKVCAFHRVETVAEEELALVDNEVLAKGKRLGAELLQHLANLDPEAVFSVRSGDLMAIRVLTTGGRDPGELFSLLLEEHPRRSARPGWTVSLPAACGALASGTLAAACACGRGSHARA